MTMLAGVPCGQVTIVVTSWLVNRVKLIVVAKGAAATGAAIVNVATSAAARPRLADLPRRDGMRVTCCCASETSTRIAGDWPSEFAPRDGGQRANYAPQMGRFNRPAVEICRLNLRLGGCERRLTNPHEFPPGSMNHCALVVGDAVLDSLRLSVLRLRLSDR